MPELLTMQDLANGHLDVKALGEAANGDENTIVTTRTGNTYPSAERAINIMFKNGGLPTTPFPTLAEMNTDGASLADGQLAMVYNETANNGLYVKTAGAWVKSNYDPVSNANQFSADKIESLKDSLIVTSKNLFNASSATLDSFIGADGVIVSSTTYHISDFIPVDSGEYTMSAEMGAAESFRSANFYDKNKNFLRQSIYATDSNPRTITISSDTYFVRFNMRLGAPQELKRMFNEGAVALPYEPYKKELRDITFSNKQIVDIKDRLDIKDTAKLYFKNADSYNLYNYMNVVEGYGVNNTTGELEVDAAYFTTEFIPVKPSTKYGISNEVGVNGFNKTAYYDENKQFIKYINSLTKTDGFYAWTTPVNARFVRLASNYLYPSAYKRMFVEGDVPLVYKSGVPELVGVKLSDEVVAQIGEIVAPSGKNLPYVYDRDLNEIFSLSTGFTGYTDWGTRTAAQVYALYDDLMAAHSTYITKYELSPDGLGNEMAYYHFKPAKPTVHKDTKLPKVVLVSGMHGHEKAAVLSTYLFAKQLCDNWKDDAVIEAMRFGSEFYILPLANPSGWALGERKNHNQVDLNRNFPFNWSNTEPVTSSKYGGVSAASETETQNIIQMLDNAGDINIFYDHHNFQRSLDRYLWISIADESNKLLERMAQSYISRMTNKWRKEYAWVTQDDGWFAGYSDSTSSPSGGILANYVQIGRGVGFAATYEVCDNWYINPTLTKYGVELTKTGVEALVNWLAINLYYLNETL